MDENPPVGPHANRGLIGLLGVLAGGLLLVAALVLWVIAIHGLSSGFTARSTLESVEKDQVRDVGVSLSCSAPKAGASETRGDALIAADDGADVETGGDDIALACGRERDRRISLAVERSVTGVVALLGGIAVLRRRPWELMEPGVVRT